MLVFEAPFWPVADSRCDSEASDGHQEVGADAQAADEDENDQWCDSCMIHDWEDSEFQVWTWLTFVTLEERIHTPDNGTSFGFYSEISTHSGDIAGVSLVWKNQQPPFQSSLENGCMMRLADSKQVHMTWHWKPWSSKAGIRNQIRQHQFC